jgi:hypothetical protein
MSTAPLRPTRFQSTRPDRGATQPPNPLLDIHIRVCPECAGPISRPSGCLQCVQCGWGRCG